MPVAGDPRHGVRQRMAKGNNWINRLGPAGAEIVVFSFQSAATSSTPIVTVSEF
jgi:hypothetical protein